MCLKIANENTATMHLYIRCDLYLMGAPQMFALKLPTFSSHCLWHCIYVAHVVMRAALCDKRTHTTQLSASAAAMIVCKCICAQVPHSITVFTLHRKFNPKTTPSTHLHCTYIYAIRRCARYGVCAHPM